jgi:HNH endonuclease
MPVDHRRFTARIQRQALARQKFHCASCGTPIAEIGEAGRANHRFGERAEGHHVIPHKMGGPVTVENCVVLCGACHYSAHQGGLWGDISIYDDIEKLPMATRIEQIASLYPHYRG